MERCADFKQLAGAVALLTLELCRQPNAAKAGKDEPALAGFFMPFTRRFMP